jgi:hypothetical protein
MSHEKCVVQAKDLSQTGHITLWFTWECPSCKSKHRGLGFPDDKELDCQCEKCGQEVTVCL